MVVDTLKVYRSYDPTHTLSLRNMFAKDMLRRFNSIISVIKVSVIERDCFGLSTKIKTHEVSPAGWEAFNYTLSKDKVIKFMEWLQAQVDAGVLDIREFEQLGTAIDAAWQNKYLYDSYKRGVLRARYELQKAGYPVPSIESSGGIEMVLANPFHVDRLGLIYTRSYNELKGITDAMDSAISRVLAQGLADGDGPTLLARKLVATINGQGIGDLGMTDTLGRYISPIARAEMLARTEIIRAHHLATIQEYRNWGLLGIRVEAELVTAGDTRVCSKCENLAKNGPYTLDQAENLIPAHPNCRCVALPIVKQL